MPDKYHEIIEKGKRKIDKIRDAMLRKRAENYCFLYEMEIDYSDRLTFICRGRASGNIDFITLVRTVKEYNAMKECENKNA